MSDRIDPPMDHPDELLAGYVDGTAPAGDRREVERHLATCPVCREEVELAAAARAALASLPELDAPGLTAVHVEALRRAGLHVLGAPEAGTEARSPHVPTPVPAAPPRIPSRRRVAWPQLAAAAALVILLGGLVAIPLALSRGGGSSRSAATVAPEAPQAASPQTLPQLIDRGASYTTDSLDALAVQLAAAQQRHLVEASGPGAATPAPTLAPPKGATLRDAAAARSALECVISGGGPSEGAIPVYLEQADVSGTPAYIGAFVIPGARLNFMVIAVSRETCVPLYSRRESI